MFEHRPFGESLKLTISGASHASSLRFELANFPAGFHIDFAELQAFMERRAPGRNVLSTQRHESDEVRFVSGVEKSVTTGEPIRALIANQDARPQDYGAERTIPRPGHADFGQWVELGRIPSGGGTNSGRLTAAYCGAGALCLQYLAERGIEVTARIKQIAGCESSFDAPIRQAARRGDSVGGVIQCSVNGLPPGLGGALFAGLDSELSAALFAIPGVKGVSVGNGFESALLSGVANDDSFEMSDKGFVRTSSNNHGGVLGGRTSGMPLEFEVALKPTPTVYCSLSSVDLATSQDAKCTMKGRHDPCIVRRALPVVEAVTAFVLMDLILAHERARPQICLTLTGHTLEENFQQYRSQYLFVDLVELRADLLTPTERTRVAEFPAWLSREGKTPWKVPVVLTLRRACDGGADTSSKRARQTFFQQALQTAAMPFAYVDFEDDFRVPKLAALARARGTRIIRSRHDFSGPIRNLLKVCQKMVAGTDEIAKVAYMPKTPRDVCAAFTCKDSCFVPHIVLAMGPIGRVTRTWAVLTGSCWTYASVDGLAALGHATPHELVRDARFRVQTTAFARYGVTGWPLTVTRSPELHNAAFLAEDEDAVMAALPARTVSDILRFIQLFDLKGLAVTIPHKEAILSALDAISPEAKAIGAVNTIARRNGKLIGFNTDAAGFTEAITAFLGVAKLSGCRVAVLGAGGASKAVVWALRRLRAKVEVFHRQTPSQGFDLLVNATPVDPIPTYVFTGREAVYDLRYEPSETPLMARARAAGCRVENGLSMLTAQARLQREIWRQS